MPRTPVRALVVAALGALTTVAVAWWCGWRSKLDPAAGIWGHVALDPSTGEPVPSLADGTVQPGINVHLQSGPGVAYLGLARSGEVAKFDHHVPVAGFWPSFGPLREREPKDVLAATGSMDLPGDGRAPSLDSARRRLVPRDRSRARIPPVVAGVPRRCDPVRRRLVRAPLRTEPSVAS